MSEHILFYFTVIAGESMGIKSEIRTLTPTSYLDFTVDPGAEFEQPITQGWTTFAYTLEGNLKFGKIQFVNWALACSLYPGVEANNKCNGKF